MNTINDRQFITVTPSVGRRVPDFINVMREVSRLLSRIPIEKGQALIADYRARICSDLRSPQTTEQLKFALAVNIMLDLLTIGWTARVRRGKVEIAAPQEESLDVNQTKAMIRQGHLADRHAQLSKPSVLEFIRSMERRTLTEKGWHSIFSLMRDGASLAADLARVARIRDHDDQSATLAKTVAPYLELVTENARCPHTGLRLRDVWRYFRHTWVNTYDSLPGRSMMFLIRDSTAPNHPVIGIAALGSAVAQQKRRDEWIGWDQDTFVATVAARPSTKYARWALESLEGLIRSIHKRDLIAEDIFRESDIRNPTGKVVQGLLTEADKAIKQHRLYPMAAAQKSQQTRVSHGVDWEKQARTNLFRAKRCRALARLLGIREIFQATGLIAGTKVELTRALGAAAFRKALGQLVRMVKATHVGIDMMDIVVCGAIPPYNVLLGGKLVCMLICSPEVVNLYTRRYGHHSSVIASSMQGSPVVRPPRLTLLSTTSLYGVGSSQYNRVKVPCERVGGVSGGSVNYICLGTGKGYGTYHVNSVSLEIADALVARRKRGRQVNSIFGEGANPKLRKLREAIDEVGLPSDKLLRHGNGRVVYVIPLAKNFREILLGVNTRPAYYLPRSQMKRRSEQIAEYWRNRWLIGRLGRPGILEEVAKHTLAYPISHGARVVLPGDDVAENMPDADPGGAS